MSATVLIVSAAEDPVTCSGGSHLPIDQKIRHTTAPSNLKTGTLINNGCTDTHMSALEKTFGRTAQMIVLENLMKNRGTFTYLSGIAEETGLSHSSVSRVIEPLLAIGIIDEKKVGKQIRTFTLNGENPVTELVLNFYDDMSKLLPD